ncbi:PREDICTED: protein lin-54 homolog [Elephantulus edwardii]|uniref:protein lin-54 homolog n=1 Tax=Elephantulus edwardii TaxID=28737 RepID=UPI0003F0A9A2|nr:PREDICTED: protein lin-54 homolog [Elephantulus edwardii]
MEVVPAEMNSLLPEEIMDTGITLVDDDSIEAVIVSSPIPMETELEEIVNINSTGDSTATPISTEPITVYSNHTNQVAVNTTVTKADSNTTTKPAFPSGLQKLGAQTPVTISTNQIILNKVSQTSDLKLGNQTLKPDGQKLILTTLGKSGSPIVLALPHSQLPQAQKVTTQAQSGDAKLPPQQIKVVTIGGRPEVKPVIGVSALTPGSQLINTTTQPSVVQTQQLKTVQIAKKPRTPTSGPVITKLIFAKPINSKAVTGQTTQVSPPVIAGRVLSQSTPGTPSKTITISESGVIGSTLNSTTQTPNKIAISPLKSPNKAVKSSVQTITVGGVSTSQFKTIIPLATAPNVQQIQVPGSKFHYVRLVTATTASSSTQPVSQNPSTNTQPLQQAKPVVVNATPVRMSVPIVPAQTVKQVVPKPINPTSQIVTTSQPQQRLIMPATPLPQIQPNLTNLPPGTVLAPAPGTGNVGYAVLPAQYVTQLQQSSYVSIASNSNFTGTSGIQTQARLPFNGIIPSESASRPRKPCNCTKSLCLKLYCDCFANGEFCNNCNCTNCYNNLEHENERQKAIKACLDRNPEAFKPKIGKGKEGESDRRHSKGCNCKRSGCLKNYCECYEAKIMCSSICKCIGCKNFEESPERKTLMHLADAAEVRVQQQTAAKTKLSSQISDLLTRPTPALNSGGGNFIKTTAPSLDVTHVAVRHADAVTDHATLTTHCGAGPTSLPGPTVNEDFLESAGARAGGRRGRAPCSARCRGDHIKGLVDCKRETPEEQDILLKFWPPPCAAALGPQAGVSPRATLPPPPPCVPALHPTPPPPPPGRASSQRRARKCSGGLREGAGGARRSSRKRRLAGRAGLRLPRWSGTWRWPRAGEEGQLPVLGQLTGAALTREPVAEGPRQVNLPLVPALGLEADERSHLVRSLVPFWPLPTRGPVPVAARLWSPFGPRSDSGWRQHWFGDRACPPMFPWRPRSSQRLTMGCLARKSQPNRFLGSEIKRPSDSCAQRGAVPKGGGRKQTSGLLWLTLV